MSLGLRSLLCISGLVACSHNAATTARGPGDAPAQTAISSEPVTQADAQTAISSEPVTQAEARENPVLTRANPGTPPSRPPSNATPPQLNGDERTTRRERDDDGDLGLRQRIRQAAMADGSL